MNREGKIVSHQEQSKITSENQNIATKISGGSRKSGSFLLKDNFAALR